MKKLFSLMLLAALMTAGCSKNDTKTSDNKSTGQNPNTNVNTQNTSTQDKIIEVQLPTIQCGTCKKNIENAVKQIDGVNTVNVVLKDKIAKVEYDNSKTDLSKIEGAIIAAGYQANNKPADKKAYDKLEACCKIGGHDK
ncbi:MAG: heavy-metal-associated domain-containing protein [bacterium]